MLWALVIVSAVLVVSLMTNISENDADPAMGSWINNNLVWAYILVFAAAGMALFFGIIQMLTNKKAAKAGLISIAFMGAVVLISYLIASPEIPKFLGVDKFINDGSLTANVAKLIDTGLYATYILIAIAILSILFSSVTRLFK